MINMITNILEQIDNEFLNIDDMEERYDIPKSYIFGNIEVPRVTAIIGSFNTDTTYLCKWANSLGYRHQNYEAYMRHASGIGTAIHSVIEDYINEGKEPEYNALVTDVDKEILNNAYLGFKTFWDSYKATHSIAEYKVEWKIVTPYYGGTLDLWVKETNGNETIYDFKSCNHIKYKHFVQLAAYKYSVENYSNEPHHINKLAILKINKNKPEVIEYMVDESLDVNRMYIDNCTQCFFSMLYTYFNSMRAENGFKQLIIGGK